MSVTPSDLLHNKKDLNKKIDVEDIDLSEISIEDLVFNKKNYKNYINLKSLLEGVSTCQISDAYNGISRRSGVIKELKPINRLRVWGRITTCKTNSDDWGTSALAIDEANDGDILFIKTNNSYMSVWGELASTCAKLSYFCLLLCSKCRKCFRIGRNQCGYFCWGYDYSAR